MVAADPLAVDDPDRVRFVALGDAGKGNVTQRQVGEAIVRHCEARGCDFVVLLGDLVYPRGLDGPDDPDAERLIVAPYAKASVPVVAVLGNHDYAHGGNRKRASFMLQWAATRDDVVLPGHAYWTTAGPATFVALDTADAMRFGAQPQRAWLEGVLDALDDERWIVAVGHHPRWSNGPHGNAGTYEGWTGIPWVSGRSVRTLLEPLHERADLYLAGHDHSRQFIDNEGMLQIVSGAGGSSTRLVDRGNDTRFATATPGFVWIELGRNRGRLEFVDRSGTIEWTTEVLRSSDN